MTDQLIAALRRLGAVVVDLRGTLPVHGSKTFARREPSQLRGLVVHHSAGPPGGRSKLAEVAAYHVGPNHISSSGCPGICYSLGITSQGEICILWDLDRATWSQGDQSQPGDENKEWLSVLVVGDFRSPSSQQGGEPTLEQMSAYLLLARSCRATWGAGFGFAGHYAFGKPACPGSTLEAMARALDVGTQKKPAGSTLQVQDGLAALGYLSAGDVDGHDGPITRKAVSTFQRDQGLRVDGLAGPSTWAALTQVVLKGGARPASW